MTDPRPPQRAQRGIILALRWGVWVTGILFCAGIMVESLSPSGTEALTGLNTAEFFQAIAGKKDIPASGLLLYSGVLVLMLTPMLRILGAATMFVLERDWKFATVSAGVFLALAVELFLSLSA